MAKNELVLLVEDDANDAVLIGRAFKQAKLEKRLITVSDGRQAMNYLRGYCPYGNRELYPLPILMLLDLDLPILHGFQVLEQVRSDPQFTGLPIVVLTASVFSPDVKRAYALGANSFLVKPASSEDLAAMLKTVTDFWLRTCQLPAHTHPPKIATLPHYTISHDAKAQSG